MTQHLENSLTFLADHHQAFQQRTADAALSHIEQQPRIKARVSLSRLEDGRLIFEQFGDADELAGMFQTNPRAKTQPMVPATSTFRANQFGEEA